MPLEFLAEVGSGKWLHHPHINLPLALLLDVGSALASLADLLAQIVFAVDTGSIARTNNSGDRGSPCLSPLPWLNHSSLDPLTKTDLSLKHANR